MIRIKHFANVICTVILLSPCFISAINIQKDSTDILLSAELKKVRKTGYKNSEQTIELYKANHKKQLKQGDTIQAIISLMVISDVYGNIANYAKAYDNHWAALILCEDIKNDLLKSNLYLSLGRMYSFYKRKVDAFKYFNTSLQIKKDLLAKNKLDRVDLLKTYYTFASTYREFDDVKNARTYLDSCFITYTKNDSNNYAFLRFEEAYVLTQENKTHEARKIMREIEPWFFKNEPSYLTLVYTYWGDIHKKLSNFEECISFYNKALEVSKTYNSHIDFSILIYEKLTAVYLTRNNYKKAYENHKIAQDLNTQLFDSRSENNWSVLEIKDEVRLEKERQTQLIQNQKLDKLNQESKIQFLQRILLVGAIIFIIIFGLTYLRQVRSKHKHEKELIQKNKEIEVQKAKDEIELKNKELAASALQLVQKNEFIKDIKTRLRQLGGNIKASEMNKILKSASIENNANNWEEFKLRFTSINDDFYQKLNTDYPKLSQNDKRICALIKLNFSSKDIAKLLGISVESVHTNRYRLRKKMNISKGENLENFISSI
ncbi:hypothetical protein [uncultured Algibacter sp.]|uniref:hypothetical protein n=1 Tax=uncultured Algibacter sp. TaxID=298659 RepID=UPI0026115A70|nr:hypothetical protein [uncultured Algibacter sp.]